MPQVKFYADTLRDNNKLFKFRVNNEQDAYACLRRCKRALQVTRYRAAYYNSRRHNINKQLSIEGI